MFRLLQEFFFYLLTTVSGTIYIYFALFLTHEINHQSRRFYNDNLSLEEYFLWLLFAFLSSAQLLTPLLVIGDGETTTTRDVFLAKAGIRINYARATHPMP